MKKTLALSLALMFSPGMAGTAFAASEPDMVAELLSEDIKHIISTRRQG